jgi:hypothetical protein
MSTVMQLLDDLDGTPAGETMLFSIDGIDYEIDLSDVNAAQVREQFGRLTAAGRRIGTVKHPRGQAVKRHAPKPPVPAPVNGKSGPARRDELLKIREWAAAQGIAVPDRGRMPGHIIEAYNEANGDTVSGN